MTEQIPNVELEPVVLGPVADTKKAKGLTGWRRWADWPEGWGDRYIWVR